MVLDETTKPLTDGAWLEMRMYLDILCEVFMQTRHSNFHYLTEKNIKSIGKTIPQDILRLPKVGFPALADWT